MRLAAGIDRLDAVVALTVRWALLANAVLIAGNAVSRKFFGVVFLAAYDLQWHFFAAVVLLMAAYTLQRDQHVRVDVFASQWGERGLAWIDLVGIVFIVLPLCGVMVAVSTPSFVTSILSGETRATRESVSDLPAWIIKSFLPAGFLLLGLQAIAEAIRRVAFLRGHLQQRLQRSTLIQEDRSER